ncbi:hypothetical protein AB0B63_06960 [Micromonospora sp. NPDC049081]|uniref:hypothetical protein n=1 Tax=Micromonospora sp. NPDC049081 TaxID=3155150 RepID=UPI0033C2ABD5
MQPLTASPRQAMPAEQVTYLLRDSNALTVTAGCELVDQNLEVVEDISTDLVGGSVSRNSYATLHGTASLALSRELAWSSALVRPYMEVCDEGVSARFHLGVYYTSVPERTFGEVPVTYDVAGVDILHGLYSPTGEAYAVAAGTSYLAAVEQILREQGYTRYLIDQTRADSVLPSARVWPLDDQTRWLSIVNDLLSAIGYQGIWSDWDGQLRCQPYQVPNDRAVEWVYDAGQQTSMLSPARTAVRDFFEAPNRWVIIRQNNVDGPPPVDGDGMFVFQNDFEGDTSVSARNGRIITRVEYTDAADHEALVRTALSMIDADMRAPTTLRVATFPNPLHWHFDRLVLDDPDIGRFANVLATSWTLPFDGSDMTHEWRII